VEDGLTGAFCPADAGFYFRGATTQGNADRALPRGASSYGPVAGLG
jgi:hypothetical protein